MATMDRKGKIPVYDEEGDLIYFEVNLPPSSPEQKLHLGSNPQDIIKSEKELRRHKRELHYKEPASTFMLCKRCDKRIIRQHATQLYCKECGILVKRQKTRARIAKWKKGKKK